MIFFYSYAHYASICTVRPRIRLHIPSHTAETAKAVLRVVLNSSKIVTNLLTGCALYIMNSERSEVPTRGPFECIIMALQNF